MINKSPDIESTMSEEARRSKERVRQLLMIQIDAQLGQDETGTESETWNDVSFSGEHQAIRA